VDAVERMCYDFDDWYLFSHILSKSINLGKQGSESKLGYKKENCLKLTQKWIVC